MARRTEVYYWAGGREVGEWRRVNTRSGYPPESAADTIESLERAGYVTVLVNPNIGPPEGAPDDDRFRRLGL